MRTTKLLLTLIVASFAALTIGCGKQEGNTSAGIGYYPGNGPYIPNIPGPGSNPGYYDGIDWEHGGTATLNATGMNAYLGCTYNCPAAPTNVRINLNLKHFPGIASKATYHSTKGEAFNGYGGVVTIGYDVGSNRYEDRFSSLVNPNGMVTTDAENNKYNKWRLVDGKWRGFFQDYYGSLVIVIDQVQDYGDGSAPAVSGEVYFKNHPVGINLGPLSPTSCWFVVTGPYDCRTWKSGKKVDVESASLYPNSGDGYVKLGRFSTLDAHKAFNSTTL